MIVLVEASQRRLRLTIKLALKQVKHSARATVTQEWTHDTLLVAWYVTNRMLILPISGHCFNSFTTILTWIILNHCVGEGS